MSYSIWKTLCSFHSFHSFIYQHLLLLPPFFPLSGSLSLLLPLYLSQSLTFPASITFEEAQIFHRHTWGRIPSSWGDLHFKCNALCNVGNAFCINPIVEYIFGNLTVHGIPFPGICFQTEINCLFLYKFNMKSENYRGKYFQTTYLLIYYLAHGNCQKLKPRLNWWDFLVSQIYSNKHSGRCGLVVCEVSTWWL